jgi:hypothetical protein
MHFPSPRFQISTGTFASVATPRGSLDLSIHQVSLHFHGQRLTALKIQQRFQTLDAALRRHQNHTHIQTWR